MKEFIKVMKALSDPNRVKILKMLQHKTMCVCEMHEALQVSQPTVSNGLKILEEAGLDFREDGLWVNGQTTERNGGRTDEKGKRVVDMGGGRDFNGRGESAHGKQRLAGGWQLVPKGRRGGDWLRGALFHHINRPEIDLRLRHAGLDSASRDSAVAGLDSGLRRDDGIKTIMRRLINPLITV